jgi:hypothetical protein
MISWLDKLTGKALKRCLDLFKVIPRHLLGENEKNIKILKIESQCPDRELHHYIPSESHIVTTTTGSKLYCFMKH